MLQVDFWCIQNTIDLDGTRTCLESHYAVLENVQDIWYTEWVVNDSRQNISTALANGYTEVSPTSQLNFAFTRHPRAPLFPLHKYMNWLSFCMELLGNYRIRCIKAIPNKCRCNRVAIVTLNALSVPASWQLAAALNAFQGSASCIMSHWFHKIRGSNIRTLRMHQCALQLLF